MKKVILYTAVSLDNFIARAGGEIDWLMSFPNPDKLDFGYTDFYNDIDTTLMGNKTYEQLLSFECEFPYKKTTNYVFTRDKNLLDNNDVSFITEDIADFVSNLKKGDGKDIWLVGGGQINAALVDKGLIDVLFLSVFPIALGEGIPLFNGTYKEHKFDLIDSERFSNGIINLRYQKQAEPH